MEVYIFEGMRSLWLQELLYTLIGAYLITFLMYLVSDYLTVDDSSISLSINRKRVMIILFLTFIPLSFFLKVYIEQAQQHNYKMFLSNIAKNEEELQGAVKEWREIAKEKDEITVEFIECHFEEIEKELKYRYRIRLKSQEQAWLRQASFPVQEAL